MALTLNKVIGRSPSGKLIYDRAGSPTNPIRNNDGTTTVNKTGPQIEPKPLKRVTNTETINGEKLLISVKPSPTDALGETAIDKVIQKNKAEEAATNVTPILVVLGALLLLR